MLLLTNQNQASQSIILEELFSNFIILLCHHFLKPTSQETTCISHFTVNGCYQATIYFIYFILSSNLLYRFYFCIFLVVLQVFPCKWALPGQNNLLKRTTLHYLQASEGQRSLTCPAALESHTAVLYCRSSSGALSLRSSVSMATATLVTWLGLSKKEKRTA